MKRDDLIVLRIGAVSECGVIELGRGVITGGRSSCANPIDARKSLTQLNSKSMERTEDILRNSHTLILQLVLAINATSKVIDRKVESIITEETRFREQRV